jgi:transposase
VGGSPRGAGQPGDDEPGHHPGSRLAAQKKSLSASERDEAQRAAWRRRTRGVDPRRFVWVDETGAHRGLTPRYSRAPRGQRARGTAPRNRGPNRTLLTALTPDGFGPGLLFDAAITGDTFAGYVRHVLAPTLQPGQIVVVDNLRAHRDDRAQAATTQRGAELWFLPSYSPDLTPIEEGFSKFKAHLRRAEARADAALSAAIWDGLATITPRDVRGWYRHAGYPLTPHRPRDHLS